MIKRKQNHGVPVFYTGVAFYFTGLISLVLMVGFSGLFTGCGATNSCSGLFCSGEADDSSIDLAATALADEDAVSFDMKLTAQTGLSVSGQIEVYLDSGHFEPDSNATASGTFTSTDPDTYAATTTGYSKGYNDGTLYLKMVLTINDTRVSEDITWYTSNNLSVQRTFLAGTDCADSNPGACVDGYYASSQSIALVNNSDFPAPAEYSFGMSFYDAESGTPTPIDLSKYTGTMSVTDGNTPVNKTDFSGYNSATNSLSLGFDVYASGTYTGNFSAAKGSVSVNESLSQDLTLDFVTMGLTADIKEFSTIATISVISTVDRQQNIVLVLSAKYSDGTIVDPSEILEYSLEWRAYVQDVNNVAIEVTDILTAMQAVTVTTPDELNEFIIQTDLPSFMDKMTFIAIGTARAMDGVTASTCYKYFSFNPAETQIPSTLALTLYPQTQEGIPFSQSGNYSSTSTDIIKLDPELIDLTEDVNSVNAIFVKDSETPTDAINANASGGSRALATEVRIADDGEIVISMDLSAGQLGAAAAGNTRVLLIMEKKTLDGTGDVISIKEVLMEVPSDSFHVKIEDLGWVSFINPIEGYARGDSDEATRWIGASYDAVPNIIRSTEYDLGY